MRIFNRHILRCLSILVLLMLIASNASLAKPLDMEKDISRLKSNFELKEGKFTGLGRDKNLLVVQVDSLQNFLIGLEYNDQEILPNMNKLIDSQGSIYYNNYHQLVGLADGGDAEFVSNNSFFPYLDGVSYEEYRGSDFYSLAHMLKEKDYRTSLITDSKGSLWNRQLNFREQGFDNFYPRESFELETRKGFLVEPGEILTSSIGKIKNETREDDKFFSYISSSVRDKSSLDINENEDFQILPEDEDNRLVKYFSMMNSLDKKLGRLIEDLKAGEIYEDTVLTIQGGTSGLPLGDWKGVDQLEKILGAEYEYSKMMNIPLIVHIPGAEIKETVNNLGSHLDFYPTMKNILGIEDGRSMGMGKDISNISTYRSISLGRHAPKGSFYDGDNVFLLSRLEDFDSSETYRVGSDEKMGLDYLEGIYLTLKDEMDLSHKILKNNLISEIKEIRDRSYENVLVRNAGSINDILSLHKMGYKNFIVGPKDNLYDLKDLEDIKIILEMDRHSLDSLKDNSNKVDSVIIRDESIYGDVKNAGFDRIILDARRIVGEIKNQYEIVILDKKDLGKEVLAKKYLDKADVELSENFKEYGGDGYLVNSKHIFAFEKEKEVKNKHLIAHAGGKLKDKTYTNSLDAVKNSYEGGIRLMEIDFEWTSDNKLVSTHSWDGFIKAFFGVPVDRYSYDDFVNFKMINGWQQLYPDLIEDMTNIYSDTFIVTDIKDRNIEALERMTRENPHMVNKLIPQVYNFEEYLQAKELGFDNIILTLYLIDETNEDIVKFAKKHKPFAITMPLWRVETGLAADLKRAGVFTYTHTVNDLNLIGDLESKGVMGIYTDSIQANSR